MTYERHGRGTDPDCQWPCDPDCELGPVHCMWHHEAGHRTGWHDPDACDRKAEAG
jgi:hypothetical protein